MPTKAIRLIKRARLELQKAKNLLYNLEKMPNESVKSYIRFLLSAMSLVGEALIEKEKGRGHDPFENLDKTILKKHKLESELYELYFYLKNMLYKQTDKRGSQVQVKSWKSTETLNKTDLKDFYKKVETFIDQSESKITSST